MSHAAKQIVHDFTESRMGHSLSIFVRYPDDVTYSVLGHCDDSLAYMQTHGRIEVGHFIKLTFGSGKKRLLRVETVEYFRDPPDMFKATVLKGEWSMTEDETSPGRDSHFAAQPQGVSMPKFSTDQSRDALRVQHSHRAPDQDAQQRLRDIRQRCLDLAVFLDDQLPPSRERSCALTKLDEARMWACSAAVAGGEIREQLTVNIPS